MCFINLKQ